MKTMFLLLLVISVGCSKESKKEKCVYNGQEVPCSSMNNQGAPDLTPVRGRVLKAEITAAISIDHHTRTIEILENTFDMDSTTVERTEVKCGIETRSGERGTYQVTGSNLIIKSGGKAMKLKRLSGHESSILGEWQIHETTNGIRQVSVYRFKENSMNVKGTCTIL